MTDRVLKKSVSGVLASLRGSMYGPKYDSLLHSLRPCCTAFLNTLRAFLIGSVLSRRLEILGWHNSFSTTY